MKFERIQKRRKELGLTQQALADLVGVSKGTISQWESGDYSPGGQNLVNLAKSLAVSPDWLINGKELMKSIGIDPDGPGMKAAQLQETAVGKKFLSSLPEISETTPPLLEALNFADQYALIPLYNVSAAAGHGAVVDHEEVVDSLAFKRDWISHTLHAQPGDLYLINVQGESMTPTLHPGDVILVDRRNGENITTDGVYVIRMGDSLLVKRIQRLPGKTLRISSDNPAYQSFELKLDAANDDELSVIGRVVWSGRRM